MFRLIPRVVLLAMLVMAVVASSAPAFTVFGAKSKTCHCLCFFCKSDGGSCKLDDKTGQCVNLSCKQGCVQF